MGPAMAREGGPEEGRAGAKSTTSRPIQLTSTWSTRPSIRSTTRPAKASSPRRPRRRCFGRCSSTSEQLPDLGKIWAAQERLWIQRTVLEVIAEVNKNAKDWDEAIIRQIVSLEVGSPDAQDQRSLAKSETLEESKPIYAPGEEPAADGAVRRAAGRRQAVWVA